ncbi:unnamed protein product [Withania somnifera]
MGFTYNQESSNHSKRFKFLVSALKDAFINCHSFRRRSHSRPEEDDLVYDYDYEDEVFISAVISQYMELKCRRKTTITTDKFTWAFSPTTGDLFISARLGQKEDKEDQEKEVREDFHSVASHLSPCSSATSSEAFVTAKTVFSRSSSLDRIDFQDPWRRHSVIKELSDCEGWPFGLYRKALFLPPPPKSPSDSWSWRKSTRMVKMH